MEATVSRAAYEAAYKGQSPAAFPLHINPAWLAALTRVFAPSAVATRRNVACRPLHVALGVIKLARAIDQLLG